LSVQYVSIYLSSICIISFGVMRCVWVFSFVQICLMGTLQTKLLFYHIWPINVIDQHSNHESRNMFFFTNNEGWVWICFSNHEGVQFCENIIMLSVGWWWDADEICVILFLNNVLMRYCNHRNTPHRCMIYNLVNRRGRQQRNYVIQCGEKPLSTIT